jgi:hypothetical protein
MREKILGVDFGASLCEAVGCGWILAIFVMQIMHDYAGTGGGA